MCAVEWFHVKQHIHWYYHILHVMRIIKHCNRDMTVCIAKKSFIATNNIVPVTNSAVVRACYHPLIGCDAAKTSTARDG